MNLRRFRRTSGWISAVSGWHAIACGGECGAPRSRAEAEARVHPLFHFLLQKLRNPCKSMQRPRSLVGDLQLRVYVFAMSFPTPYTWWGTKRISVDCNLSSMFSWIYSNYGDINAGSWREGKFAVEKMSTFVSSRHIGSVNDLGLFPWEPFINVCTVLHLKCYNI